MHRQDENSGLSGWLWCVIIAIVVGFLIACALLIINDGRNGDFPNWNIQDPEARAREEFGLVILCTVTSCVFALIIFGIWKRISYYNSPEQERKRILRRHPPLYGRH
jgi:hypothetical protein